MNPPPPISVLDRSLLDAVVRRDPLAVRRALETGAKPNAADPRTGITAAIYAVSLDMSNVYRPQILKSLAEWDADFGKGDHNGSTPLHEAALRGDTTSVEFLLKQKAPIEAKNAQGKTPLRVALDHALHTGRTAMMNLLIARGASMKTKDGDGLTLLQAAEKNKDITLYSRGAFVQVQAFDEKRKQFERTARGMTAEEEEAQIKAANENAARLDARRKKNGRDFKL